MVHYFCLLTFRWVQLQVHSTIKLLHYLLFFCVLFCAGSVVHICSQHWCKINNVVFQQMQITQNQTPSKLFSVLPLESGMFQVTISIIKKWFDPSVCCMASKLGSGQVWTFVTMDTVNVIIIQRKTICMQF